MTIIKLLIKNYYFYLTFITPWYFLLTVLYKFYTYKDNDFNNTYESI